MLTPEELDECRRADKYELSGPLTKTDYHYCSVAELEVRKLRNRGRIFDDEYSAESRKKCGMRRQI